MRQLVTAFRVAWHGRKGVAALEFALAAPFLILMLLAIVDFGRAIDQSIRLETAARSGAQYALSFPEDLAGISSAVSAALTGQTGLHTPQVTMACECPGSGGTATADPGCTSTCTDRRRLVTVVVRQDFTALHFVRISTLSGNVTLRLE